jgi:glutamyl-tRNA reductase
MNGQAVRFDDWQLVLEQVDVVIGSTGAPHVIVQKADVEVVRRKRKYRPLFFIDIAVPRDIDPAVAEIEEVYLYDIDTLEQIASEARVRRAKQIELCEEMIREELGKAKLLGL